MVHVAYGVDYILQNVYELAERMLIADAFTSSHGERRAQLLRGRVNSGSPVEWLHRRHLVRTES